MRTVLKKLAVFLLMGLVGGCAGAVAGKKMPPPLSFKSEYVITELTSSRGIDVDWDSMSQSISVSRGHNVAQGLVGSEIVLVNGQQVLLSVPIKFENGTVVVPRDFKEKVIDRLVTSADRPLESSRSYRVHKVRTVVIDAGHGGKDPGAIGPSGIYEKDVVLDITKRLRKILKRKGLNVIMTRDTDEFISLKERTVLASKNKADLFVSVHANAHARRSINGVEVYTLRDLDVFEKNEEQRQDNHEILFKNYQMKRNDDDLKIILSDMFYDYKQAEAATLAQDTSHKVAHFLGAKDLGKKSSRFFVLRNTLVPAILVEVGYLTNPKEERLLKTNAYRQKVAYALARSILDYANTR